MYKIKTTLLLKIEDKHYVLKVVNSECDSEETVYIHSLYNF